jgi:hypothetical protein
MTIPATMPHASGNTPALDVAGTEACPACPHPLDIHDAIALRFCRATMSGGKPRGCACSPS